MITIKIGRRGQITLPSQIRRQMGLKEGDRLALLAQEDSLVIRPISQTLQDLRGSVLVDGPQDFDHIRQQVQLSRAARKVPHGD